MNTVDEILRFFGTAILAGSGGAAVSLLLFKYLAKGWIDARFAERMATFKHEQEKVIARMKVEVESTLSGALKMQEREFAVLPEAWAKLHAAYGTVAWVASAVQTYPDVGRMSEAQLEELLAQSEFAESEKQQLRDASGTYQFGQQRNAKYQELLRWQRINKANKAAASLQKYVAANGLFLAPDLKAKFKEICQKLNEVIVQLQISAESRDWKLESHASDKVALIAPMHSAIEAAIEQRLHAHGRLMQ